MAIKVISKEAPAELAKEVTCTHCGWTHSYLKGDVKHAIHYDYGGGSDSWWYILCQNTKCLRVEGVVKTKKRNYIEVKRP